MADKNIRVSQQTHEEAVKYTQAKGLLLGKYVDSAIKEKVEKDLKKKSKV